MGAWININWMTRLDTPCSYSTLYTGYSPLDSGNRAESLCGNRSERTGERKLLAEKFYHQLQSRETMMNKMVVFVNCHWPE